MHRYDTILKSLLQELPKLAPRTHHRSENTGQWLNVELPQVTQTRVDLLGETAGDKRLVGFELESVNNHLLALRMAEYWLRIYRLQRRFPEQYVLYLAKLRMPSHLDDTRRLAQARQSSAPGSKTNAHLSALTSASKNSPPPQSKKSPCAYSTPKPWQTFSLANARPALIPAPLLLAQKPNCDTTGMVL